MSDINRHLIYLYHSFDQTDTGHLKNLSNSMTLAYKIYRARHKNLTFMGIARTLAYDYKV
jgi:hypothetical protein